MDIRAQIAMVFHLDKCIGCHTCSIACKNVWTDRGGTEYMWWNNVETKPGTGYPTLWEDQEQYHGGWRLTADGRLVLRSQQKLDAYIKLFYNPNQPGLDDYYEPWTYRYEDLFSAPAGDDQPTAIPVSQITGEPINIEAGPNWDDDLSGSPIYAANDANLAALSAEERAQLFEVERVAMMYVPRICNHCANPSCVAACPSGALYKRGEDGIVLVNQEICRGWRACVAGCPYKKVYYNWQTGKAEKCILCYPRLETGQPSACFHTCVGRIRFQGVLLYDAERLVEVATVSDKYLVEMQRSLLCDPHDPKIIDAARRNGISEEYLQAAQRSPVWKFVKQWGLALPLHVEYRTLPMLFYVPSLLPVLGKHLGGGYEHAGEDFFSSLPDLRLPVKYLASLFSAGNTEIIDSVLRKLLAVRYYQRTKSLGDVDHAFVQRIMREANITAEDAEEIYTLTALATMKTRYALPPIQREGAMGETCKPQVCKGSVGFGLTQPPGRGA